MPMAPMTPIDDTALPTSVFRPRFFLATAVPLLCPGIHLTLRFGFAGLRIRAFKLYNSLITKVVAGSFSEDLLRNISFHDLLIFLCIIPGRQFKL